MIAFEVMGEVSMGRYLPHIINSSLVDLHCTLFYPSRIPHWTQRSPRASPGVVADARLVLSRDELKLPLGVVAIVQLV
jgi:hypothetical protein